MPPLCRWCANCADSYGRFAAKCSPAWTARWVMLLFLLVTQGLYTLQWSCCLYATPPEPASLDLPLPPVPSASAALAQVTTHLDALRLVTALQDAMPWNNPENKFAASPEAMDEVNALQRYAAALADMDLRTAAAASRSLASSS